jgi:hypothetical protein
VAEIGREFTALPKTKDKKLVSEKAHRLLSLIRALPTGAHSAADALMLDLFARRGELAKVKGETFSGSDVAEVVIARMAGGPKSLQATVARAHPDLDAASLGAAFEAARQALPPAEVYDLFAGYLTAEGRAKKGKGTDARERAAIVKALHGDAILWYDDQDDFARSLDPRWLDLAVRIKFLTLIHAVGRPGHPVAEAFIQSEFDAAMKKGKDADKIREVISVMIRLRHPKATDALIAAYEKSIGKVNANSYWYYHLIPGLPKSAVPRLEEVLPKLKDREADQWLAAIQELREKA